MKEEWKTVQEFPNYQVSNFGKIKSFTRQKKGKLLKPITRAGVFYVCLCRNGYHTSRHIHKLVIEAFFGYREEYAKIRHIDGNKHNNRIDNLMYVKTGIADGSIKIPVFDDGSKLYKDEITEKTVYEISKMLKFGKRTIEYISERFGVSEFVVKCIRKYRCIA